MSKPEHLADLEAQGDRAHRPGRLQPVPVPRRPVDRADRRRRPDHGAGRGQELRPRRRRRRPGRLRPGARRAAPGRPAVGRHPPAAGPRRLRPHRGLRRRHRHLVRRAGGRDRTRSPRPSTSRWSRPRRLRYGENPHQQGARYRETGRHSWWDDVVQHGGMELSYLNLYDADAAWRLVHQLADLGPAAAVVVKHANPCGAAVADDVADRLRPGLRVRPDVGLRRHRRPHRAGDRVDRPPPDRQPQGRRPHRPGFDAAALDLFAAKRKNMRVLEAPAPTADRLHFRQISGGWLVQEPYRFAAGRDRLAGGDQGPADRGAVARPRAGLAGVRLGQVQRHRPGRRRHGGRHRRRPAEPGHAGRDRGQPGPRAGPRAGPRPATPSSPSATASTRWPRPAWPPSSSRAARSATTRSSPRPTSTASPWSSPARRQFQH